MEKRSTAENLEYLIYKSDVGFSGNPVEAGKDRTYSLDRLPQELPSSGVGDFREEMIRLYHEDGSCAADFRYEGYEVVKGSYEIPGLPAVYDTEQETGETLIITIARGKLGYQSETVLRCDGGGKCHYTKCLCLQLRYEEGCT